VSLWTRLSGSCGGGIEGSQTAKPFSYWHTGHAGEKTETILTDALARLNSSLSLSTSRCSRYKTETAPPDFDLSAVRLSCAHRPLRPVPDAPTRGRSDEDPLLCVPGFRPVCPYRTKAARIPYRNLRAEASRTSLRRWDCHLWHPRLSPGAPTGAAETADPLTDPAGMGFAWSPAAAQPTRRQPRWTGSGYSS